MVNIIMDLDTWRKGMTVSIDNVLQLYKDGILLMENGSFGHACFSFVTAFEEMGVALFILGTFNEPNPTKLEKFLNHSKKIGLSNITSLITTMEPFGNIRNLYHALLKDKEKNFEINKKQKSEVRKFADELQKLENLWYLRIHGLYVSLNNSKTDFLSPTHIGKEHAERLKEKLKTALPFLQVERDMLMKFGTPKLNEFDFIKNYLEIFSKFEEANAAFLEGSIEKLDKLKNVSPNFKDYFIDILLNKFPMKHKELNIEISAELNEENLNKEMKIFVYEFFKSFQDQFRTLGKYSRSKEALKYRLERMKVYSPEDSEGLEELLPIMEIIFKEDSNIEDIIKFL